MIDDALALQPDRAAWRRRVSALSMLSMESLALFVLGNLLAAPAGAAGPSLVTVLTAALLGYGLARVLQHFDFNRRVLISAGVVVSCVGLWLLGTLQYSNGPFVDSGLVLLFTDPGRALAGHAATVLGLITITFAWVRGTLVGSWPRLTQRAVLGSLTLGLGAVFLGLTFGQGASTAPASDAAALAFFVCGLVTLALLQLGLSEHIRGDSWRGPWLLVVLGTCAVLALAGAAVGLLPLSLLNPLFAALGGLLLLVLDILLYILVYPIALAATWFLVHALAPHIHPTNAKIQLPPPPDPRQLQHASHHTAAGALALALGHVLLFVAIVGGLLLVLLWLFRRVEREAAADAPQRESLEVEVGLGADLSALLAGLKRRLRPSPVPEPDLSPPLRALRRLYLTLLQRGAAHGVERPPGATPREYAPELQRALASDVPVELSDRFARGRYGQVEPSAEDLRRLQEAVDRLR